MKELIDFLKVNPVGCLATVKEDGRPSARPFQFMMEEGGKLYFCTSNKKEVYRQLNANPTACFSGFSPDTTYVRIWGKAEFVKDAAVKEKVIDSSDLVKSIYKSASNPDFEVFFLADGVAFLGDLKGNPPKEYGF